MTKINSLKNAIILAVYILLIWGLYRFLFRLPDDLEEMLVKPFFWLGAVIILLKRENASLASIGVTFKNLFPALYLSVCLGVVFALEGIVVNFFKYQGNLVFGSNLGDRAFIYTIGLSLVSAISEESVFRGYMFTRFLKGTNSEWIANLATSFVWTLIHLPIAVFVLNMHFEGVILYLLLTFLYGFGASFVFARTQNIAAPILLHVLWESPIILFR